MHAMAVDAHRPYVTGRCQQNVCGMALGTMDTFLGFGLFVFLPIHVQVISS
jgi:hypothetical protein